MKTIILAAGEPSDGKGYDKPFPPCLRGVGRRGRVLDRLLTMSHYERGEDVAIVGGYGILEIMENYPGLRYYYNRGWKKSNALESLLVASSEFNSDLLVCYADIVHEESVFLSLTSRVEEVVLAYDSKWRDRYDGRERGGVFGAEVLVNDGTTYSIARAMNGSSEQFSDLGGEELGEFAGLVFIRKALASRLSSFIEKALLLPGDEAIGNLIKILSEECKLGLIDVKGRWAELDDEADLAALEFGTKAETLANLEGILTKGRVLPQVAFNVGEWRKAKSEVIGLIENTFRADETIVVRSSAICEDTENESMAGCFESVLNVRRNDKDEVNDAVERVCSSYEKGGADEDLENQILVQPMLRDVKAAGVAFTSALESGAPYYTINYDISGSTYAITSGGQAVDETVIIAKGHEGSIENADLRKLLEVVVEIEGLTGLNGLDIEFAISDSVDNGTTVYILQVRPLATQKGKRQILPREVELELENINRFIVSSSKAGPVLCGAKTVYGVMPDWNPAEIIGINPRPLAVSLYRSIITDHIWGESREECGYRSTKPMPGMVILGGKPYIDVRMSFSSFVPKGLEKKLADRLVEAAIDRLCRDRQLHDKVEFEVMPSVFDLDSKDGLLVSYRNLYSKSEWDRVVGCYRNLTSGLLSGKKTSTSRELKRLDDLAKKVSEIERMSERGEIGGWQAMALMLDVCKRLGTLPFSNLARLAFVGVIQMRALVSLGALKKERLDAFLESIRTVAKEFVDDLTTCSREQLIGQYGHLRPGTYDITSPAYHEAFDWYVDLNVRGQPVGDTDEFVLTKIEKESIDRVLEEASLPIDAEQMLSFIRKAIQAREFGKFEFTKTLSRIIDRIGNEGKRLGFSREDLSFLDVNDFLDCRLSSESSKLSRLWREKINSRRHCHAITRAINLPELICNHEEIYCFNLCASQPNYITEQIVEGPVSSPSRDNVNIDGTICVIESADPGFDWIFTHSILGLITCYGGANSHMAIRCAEFGIPAAIGCGKKLYDSMRSTNKIRLDCSAKMIKIIAY